MSSGIGCNRTPPAATRNKLLDIAWFTAKVRHGPGHHATRRCNLPLENQRTNRRAVSPTGTSHLIERVRFNENAAVLAVARGDLHRDLVRRLFRSVQSRMVLLDCVDAIARGHLVFWREYEATRSSRFPSRIRRWSAIFLDCIFLAAHRDSPRLVSGRALHGALLRLLELVLWRPPSIAAKRAPRGAWNSLDRGAA